MLVAIFLNSYKEIFIKQQQRTSQIYWVGNFQNKRLSLKQTIHKKITINASTGFSHFTLVIMVKFPLRRPEPTPNFKVRLFLCFCCIFSMKYFSMTHQEEIHH